MSDLIEGPFVSLNCPAFAFAIGITGVGVYSYMKTNSKTSLVGGLFFGSALSYGAYLTFENPSNPGFLMLTTANLGILSATAAGVISGSRIINDDFYNAHKNKIRPLRKISEASIILHIWSLFRLATISSGALMLGQLNETNHSVLEKIIYVYPTKIMSHIVIRIL